jgi:hypothetical protein
MIGAKDAARGLLGPERSAQLKRAVEQTGVLARARLTADGRRSDRLLRECRDEFAGRRAVIMGNGPSLRRTDLSLLRDEITFGVNRVYLLFEELGFETTFLVAVNELLISQVAPEIADAPCRKFLRWSARTSFVPDDRTAYLQSVLTPMFASNVRHGIWEGATVTYVALQLAYHMGFTEVVLVGVDHSFSTTGPAHATVTSEGDDPNHFHPKYFGKGFRWQLPDLETSEIAYRLAREAFEADGRSVVDATVDGKLYVFEKRSLEEVLSSRGH